MEHDVADTSICPFFNEEVMQCHICHIRKHILHFFSLQTLLDLGLWHSHFWKILMNILTLSRIYFLFQNWHWLVCCKNCGNTLPVGPVWETAEHQLLSYSPTFSSSASRHLQSSVTLACSLLTYSSGYRALAVGAIFKGSEWGKLPKNYPMPISPPLWLECWPHWAPPKVPTTTIEKSHNSNNMVRAKSKSPWWTYKSMQ